MGPFRGILYEGPYCSGNPKKKTNILATSHTELMFATGFGCVQLAGFGHRLEDVQVVLTSSVLHRDLVYTVILEELRAGILSLCFRDSFTNVSNR